jgi:multiple sugar transport system permease protein
MPQLAVAIQNIFRFKKITKNGLQIFSLLLPGLLVFCVFTIYPIIKLFIASFFNWQIGWNQHSVFVGVQNYIKVFQDPIFKTAMTNTLMYAIVTVPTQIIIGLFVAVFIYNITNFKITFRVLYYLPVITSWVIVSLVFRYIFNNEGFLNYFLKEVMCIIDTNIHWLDRPSTGLFVAELLGIWKGIGWNMVVLLAALQAVPKQLYEAAEMDGCGSVKKFIYITLPCIKKTILFAVVMLSIGAFNVFTSIQLMTGGKPAHQTEVVLTWMYHKAFETGDFGYAAALSFIVAMVIAIIARIQFKLFRTSEERVDV